MEEKARVTQARLSAVGPVLHVVAVGVAEATPGKPTPPITSLQRPAERRRGRSGAWAAPPPGAPRLAVLRERAGVHVEHDLVAGRPRAADGGRVLAGLGAGSC